MVAPDCWDAMIYNLARVLMYQNENTLFLPSFSTIRQIIFPWGYDILHFHFTKVFSDYGLASFSFFSYVIIIINAYEIIKKEFKNENFALFISLFVAGFSQLLIQASNNKNDIPLAALTIVIINLSFEYMNNKKAIEFYLLLALLFFGITVKSYYLAFVVIFLLGFIMFIYYKHKQEIAFIIKNFIKVLRTNKILITIFLFSVIALLIYYYHHYAVFGNFSGPRDYIKQNVNTDGIMGGVINIARYTIQVL